MLLQPLDRVLTLLMRMRSVKRVATQYHEYGWVAQAKGCDLWGHGSTPQQAMEDACRLLATSQKH